MGKADTNGTGLAVIESPETAVEVTKPKGKKKSGGDGPQIPAASAATAKAARDAIASRKKSEVKSITGKSPRVIRALPKYNYSRFLSVEQQTEQDEFTVALAINMAEKGNHDPITVMDLPGDKKYEYDTVTGFNRHAAGMMIVDGFTYTDPDTGEEIRIHDPEFTLKIQKFIGNEQERMDRNFGENAFRRDLTPIDRAHQVRQLREIRNLSTKEIAARLYIDPSYVSQVEKLLLLPTDLLSLIARGKVKMGWRAAMKLTEISPEDRLAFIEAVMGGEKLTKDMLTAHIINKNSEGAPTGDDETDENSEGEGEETPTKPTHKAQQITNALLRKFYEGKTGAAESDPIRKYATFMLDKRLPGKPGGGDTQHEVAMHNVLKGGGDIMLNHLCDAKILPEEYRAQFKDLWKAAKKNY
jgi:transcriptional regulator with XRE-family HTH domain